MVMVFRVWHTDSAREVKNEIKNLVITVKFVIFNFCNLFPDNSDIFQVLKYLFQRYSKLRFCGIFKGNGVENINPWRI